MSDETDVKAWEGQLRSSGQVSDCRILWRNTITGNKRLVAYVTGGAGLTSDELGAIIRYPQTAIDVISIDTIPLRDDGLPDDDALLSRPVIDDSLLRQIETEAQHRFPERRLAAVLQEPQVPRLHIQDVIPDWTDKLGDSSLAADAPSETPRPDASASELRGAPVDMRSAPGCLVRDLLNRSAKDAPDRGVEFVSRDGATRRLSYAALRGEAENVLSGLNAAGCMPGDKVIFQFDESFDFVRAFWACQLGGIVPAPLPPARSYNEQNSGLENLKHAWTLLGEPRILSAGLSERVREGSSLMGMSGAVVVDLNQLQDAAAALEPPLGRDDLALMLFTSGSTGAPKAVMLTHDMVVRRVAGLIQADGFTRDDVTVNWIPLDHVGGIVMCHVREVFAGANQVQVAAEYVLGDIVRWLDLIERYRGSWTWAPNFAYALTVEHAAEIAASARDLSSLRVALTGGEAVSAATCVAWLKLVVPLGVPATALRPAWGMSETASASIWSAEFSPVAVAEADAAVSVGQALPGMDLRVVDDSGAICPQGEVGRLLVRGPTVTCGYFRNERATSEAFDKDGWFDTGDLAVIREDRLTIRGRRKDILIVNGVNYSCHDVETLVDSLDNAETSYTAVASVRPKGARTDQVAVFFVPKKPDDESLAETLNEIRATISRRLGFAPDYIIPVQRESIPKTSIGKIQRQQLAAALAAGSFDSEMKRADLALATDRTLPAWFFARAWVRGATLPARNDELGSVLVVGHDNEIDELVAENLARNGIDTIRVTDDVQSRQIATDHFTVNPSAPEEFKALVNRLAQGRHIGGIVYLWNYHPRPMRRRPTGLRPAVLDDSVHFFRNCLQALAQLGRDKPLRVLAASVTCEPVVMGDVDSGRSLILGYVRSVSQELPNLACHHVDLEGVDVEADAACIAGELHAWRPQREIGIRARQVYVPVLAPLPPSPKARASMLRRGGTYLLTGGLGDAGFALCTHLLKRFDAKLILVGRRNAESGAQAERLASVRRLGEVEYIACDVANSFALRDAVNTALERRRWPLDGVFHLAGDYTEQPILGETNNSSAALLGAKVQGTVALFELLQAHKKAGFVGFSSQVALFGGPMLGAYAAANQFLDAFVENWSAQEPDRELFTIDWTMLAGTRLAEGLGGTAALQSVGLLPINAHEMLGSLEILLAQKPGRYLVGLDPAGRLARENAPSLSKPTATLYVEGRRQANNLTDLVVRDDFGTPLSLRTRFIDPMPTRSDGSIDRDALQGTKVRRRDQQAPASPLEQQIALVWQHVLKCGPVGRDESFFDLGGNSIMAIKLVTALNAKFGVSWSLRDAFKAPTLGEQAAVLSGAAAPRQEDAPREAEAAAEQRIDLTPSQRRLWFVDSLGAPPHLFNISASMRFSHSIQIPALEEALNDVVAKHDALRASFPAEDGAPVQRIAPEMRVRLSQFDAGSGRDAAEIVEQEARRPFDLKTGPVVRFALVKVVDGSSVLAITAHHIITDGWTVRLLFLDILAAYQARAFGQTEFSKTRPDYVAAVQRESSSEILSELEPQFAYWRDKLAGVGGGLELTLDRARPEIATYRGGQIRRLFGPAESRKLRSLVRTQHSSLFVVLLAGYQALLHRITGQEDVTVGTVRAARADTRLQDVAGLFVNLITIRTQLSGTMRFSELLRTVQDNVLEAFENGDFPFEELVARLGVDRSLNRTPFFQIAFAVHDRSITDSLDESISLEVMEPDLQAAQYDLHLTIKERGGQIEAIWDYASDLFDRETVEWIASSYENVMNAASDDPSSECSELALLSDSQVEDIVHGWNAPYATDIPFPKPAVYSIEDRAVARPEALAVVFGSQAWTHRELQQHVNRLAHFLIGAGVGKRDRVALMFDRCFDMIVAMLAIQKAGAAYVPIDPAYPPDRIAYIAEQAQARLLLTSEHLRPILETCKCPIVFLDSVAAQLASLPDTPPDRRADMDAIAYVIFTSGSTGQPKGVEIEHRSLANLAYAQASLCRVTEQSRTLQFSPLGFDASVWEIFPTLAAGGCVVLGERFDLMPGPGLARLMRESRVTHATLPPSALRILPEGDLPDLEVVISAGEACSLELARHWAKGRVFINAYGPTETTVCACAGIFDPADDRPPSIGRPLANMKLLVLDSRMKPVPPGVVGELYVGGAGVARGYAGRPDLTAERFLPNPFSPGERLYRTGDMVRYRPDRNLDYLGRVDGQVKLRGFRIELGEIETVIRAEDGIVDAVALVEQTDPNEPGELVAYVTATDSASEALVARVSERAGRYLPSYMRPKHVFVVDRIPLTPNGKVDRKALRRPTLRAAASAPAAMPQSKLEKQVADIWSAVLDQQGIDIDSNFFDLGGHSLKMTQVHVRLEQLLGCAVPIVTLFQHPTVRGLARALAKGEDAGSPVSEEPKQRQLKDGADRLSRLAALRNARQSGTVRADGS